MNLLAEKSSVPMVPTHEEFTEHPDYDPDNNPTPGYIEGNLIRMAPAGEVASRHYNLRFEENRPTGEPQFPKERAFAIAWDTANTRPYSNGNHVPIDSVVCENYQNDGSTRDWYLQNPYSPEAVIAGSFAQWLGTYDGQDFIKLGLKKIDRLVVEVELWNHHTDNTRTLKQVSSHFCKLFCFVAKATEIQGVEMQGTVAVQNSNGSVTNFESYEQLCAAFGIEKKDISFFTQS